MYVVMMGVCVCMYVYTTYVYNGGGEGCEMLDGCVYACAHTHIHTHTPPPPHTQIYQVLNNDVCRLELTESNLTQQLSNPATVCVIMCGCRGMCGWV